MMLSKRLDLYLMMVKFCFDHHEFLPLKSSKDKGSTKAIQPASHEKQPV